MLPNDVAEGSTDMGNVSHVAPTVQLTLAIGENMGLHTPEFAARAGSPEGLAMITKRGAYYGAYRTTPLVAVWSRF